MMRLNFKAIAVTIVAVASCSRSDPSPQTEANPLDRPSSRSAELPATPEFRSRLAFCAVDQDIEISADLIGSIATLYEGERTQGAASFRSQSKLLEKFPETNRMQVYELYVQCIKDMLNAQGNSENGL